MIAPKVVCFDLGGVVVRIRRTWQELARGAGKPVREFNLNEHIRGELQAAIIEHQRGTAPLDETARRVSGAMQGAYDPSEVAALHHAQLADEYEGVCDLVTELNAAAVVTAVLSNTCADHWQRLRAYPAVAKIPHLFASHEIGAIKPDAEAYAALESSLETGGADVLFFDDTAENVQTARERGWRAMLIDPETSPAEQMRNALAREGIAL